MKGNEKSLYWRDRILNYRNAIAITRYTYFRITYTDVIAKVHISSFAKTNSSFDSF
jgi:hypothetical protein